MKKIFKFSSHFHGALIIGVLCSLLLVACGDNTPTTAIQATTAAATTAAPAATTAAATTAAATTAAATTAAATTAAVATTAAQAATTAASSGTVPANLKAGPGVDTANKVIKVGFLAPLTGQFASQGLPFQLGENVYFQNLNDNGGIDGYKIQMVSQDSQYSPQVGVQAYNKMVGDIAMFSCLFGTPVMTALKDQTAQDKVMVLYGGNAFSLLSSQNIIIAAQPFVMDVLNGYDYVTNKLGKKNIKSAIIYQDDSLGADGVVGYDAAVKAFGMQDVGKIAYKTSDTDFTAQATALKNSGAEYVYVAGVGAFIGRIITAANALGFNAHYLLQSSAWDPSLMKTNAKDSLKGSILLLSVPSWSETSIPGVNTMLAAMKKYAPNQQESSIVSSGWVQAHETYLILKQALESGDTTRDGILKASMAIKNWDFGGLVPTIPSFGTAANDRLPSRGSFIQEIDPSLPTFLKPVADAYTSDAAKSYVFK